MTLSDSLTDLFVLAGIIIRLLEGTRYVDLGGPAGITVILSELTSMRQMSDISRDEYMSTFCGRDSKTPLRSNRVEKTSVDNELATRGCTSGVDYVLDSDSVVGRVFVHRVF